MIRWAAYWWRHRNCADMLASAARQLVCRYLSWRRRTHKQADNSGIKIKLKIAFNSNTPIMPNTICAKIHNKYCEKVLTHPDCFMFARKMGNKCSDLLQYVQEYMEKHYVKHLY